MREKARTRTGRTLRVASLATTREPLVPPRTEHKRRSWSTGSTANPFDPPGVPTKIEALAAERETAIVLTAPWHERDAEASSSGSGCRCSRRCPTQRSTSWTYGITAEQAGDGSPDLVWLLREGKGQARPYSPGDRLPFGADVLAGHKPNDTVIWIESRRAVISGDTLGDFGRGLEINERWLRPGVTREEIAAGLRPLLELPVELVLPTHGGPTDREALVRALSSP
jgi:hypothetical protein